MWPPAVLLLTCALPGLTTPRPAACLPAVLLTFAYLADSPDVPHRKLLMPMPREVRPVVV